MPRISVIICTYNREKFIERAIRSALAQSFSDFEIIVMDDASSDNTEKIVRDLIQDNAKIKYFKNDTNLGISKNRNKALNTAQGKYIAILDSDDFWIDNNKLRKQVDFLENNLDYILIGSNIKIIDEKENFIKNTDFETEDVEIRKKILKSNQIPHSSVMYKKDTVEKINGYNERLSCDEDLDLFLRLGRFGKMKNLKDITTSYTKHSQSFSQERKIDMAWNHLTIVLKNFGKYPNWFTAMFWAKLRLLKSLL
ncbi:MAG: glycosyltransferase family 2 protein [Candidatus Paceibacterota bacterium]|jgi:glycosyltransferase involved in cell wall biosynthesis